MTGSSFTAEIFKVIVDVPSDAFIGKDKVPLNFVIVVKEIWTIE